MPELHGGLEKDRFIETFTEVLKKSGLEFRLKDPNEEGGFFYQENGRKKKFDENIFAIQSIIYNPNNSTEMVSANDFFADGNEIEPISCSEDQYSIGNLKSNNESIQNQKDGFDNSVALTISVKLDLNNIGLQQPYSLYNSISICFEAA